MRTRGPRSLVERTAASRYAVFMTPTREVIPVSQFDVASLPAGSKHRLTLGLDTMPDGGLLAFHVVVVRGAVPGTTCLVTGGVHGDEYEGPIAIQDLYASLDPETLAGTFVGVPIINGPAFTAGMREGGWDHQNLARIFPGSPTGTLSERIAHALTEHLLTQADFYLDMHAAGNLYAIKRFSGYQLCDTATNAVQRAAAIAFGLDLVWGTTALPGRSLSSARDKAVPAIYVEMQGEGRARPEDLVLARDGIQNVMRYLDMLPGEYPRSAAIAFDQPGEEAGHLQIDHLSPTSGLFVPRVQVWEAVEAGQMLGEVRHPDGTVLAPVPAMRSGRVLFLRTFLRVFSGDFLCYVIQLP